MAIGSGLGAQFGVSKETTYGTYVAPTRFLEVMTMPFSRKPTFIQGGGLAAGRYLRSASRNTLTMREADATITMEVPSKGFGLLLENLMGGTPTVAQQGATAAWLQTFLLGDNRGKSLTAQFGVPDTGGTVRPYNLVGGKMTSMDLSCGVGEILSASCAFDFQDYQESSALVTASYLAGVQTRNFTEMNLRLGTFGSEAAVTGVRKVNLHIERPMKTDMQYANGGGKKAEPILNDWHGITGSVETDYSDKTAFADRVPVTGTTSLVWEFTGPLIASTFYQTLRVTCSAVSFESGDPQVDGPDVVNPTFNFVIMDDLTNPPIKIEYMTTDTAL